MRKGYVQKNCHVHKNFSCAQETLMHTKDCHGTKNCHPEEGASPPKDLTTSCTGSAIEREPSICQRLVRIILARYQLNARLNSRSHSGRQTHTSPIRYPRSQHRHSAAHLEPAFHSPPRLQPSLPE